MAEGPGKYDDECTIARHLTGAAACLLVILGGNKGSGFSVHIDPARANVDNRELARILREIARQVEGN